MTFDFFQGGYTDGATVTGSFTIDDLNGNGFSTNMFPELEFFGGLATYSGSNFIPRITGAVSIAPFYFNLSTYDLVFGGESLFPPGFGEVVGIDIQHGLGSILYAPAFSGPFFRDSSSTPVVVTQRLTVPAEPVPDTGATMILLGLALSAIAVLCSKTAFNRL
jgi:hypothetical protein